MDKPTIDDRVAEDGIRMIVQNVGRLRVQGSMYADLWSCTLAFPDDESEQFWINTGQTVRIMSGVVFSGAPVDQGREKYPDIEDVLQSLCEDAVAVENSGGQFEVFLSDSLGLDSAISREELERENTSFRRMQVYTEQLRDFLGAKFGAYLYETEWTR